MAADDKKIEERYQKYEIQPIYEPLLKKLKDKRTYYENEIMKDLLEGIIDEDIHKNLELVAFLIRIIPLLSSIENKIKDVSRKIEPRKMREVSPDNNEAISKYEKKLTQLNEQFQNSITLIKKTIEKNREKKQFKESINEFKVLLEIIDHSAEVVDTTPSKLDEKNMIGDRPSGIGDVSTSLPGLLGGKKKKRRSSKKKQRKSKKISYKKRRSSKKKKKYNK